MNYSIIAEEIINHEKKIRKPAGSETDTETPEDIIDAVKYFAEENLKEDGENEFFSRIISDLPCIMSKGKFADYVTKAVKDYEVDINTYNYKMKICPFTIAEGRETFPEEYKRFDKILYTAVNKISDEELEELTESLPMGSTDVFSYSDAISMLYSDINYMTALLLYCLDIVFITDGDLVLKDLFYSAAELAAKESLDEIDIELKSQTNDKANDIISELYNDTLSTVKEYTENVKAYNKAVNKDSGFESAFKAYKNVFILYMAEAEEDICKIKTSESDGKNPETLAAEFISEFEKATAAFPPAVKKSLRLETIGNIPCPLSFDESIEYIRFVLDRYYGKPQYLSIMSDINNALYMYDKNFFNNFLENMTKLKENAAMEQADECNCGHDHHHHDDGCGCGHDHHHHGEGCGCDHNHSHFEKHL